MEIFVFSQNGSLLSITKALLRFFVMLFSIKKARVIEEAANRQGSFKHLSLFSGWIDSIPKSFLHLRSSMVFNGL
jgi:hypothetical protein